MTSSTTFFLYDLTWDWTLASQDIEHSIHLANILAYT